MVKQTITCKLCGKIFKDSPCRIKTGRKYCSKECAHKSRKGVSFNASSRNGMWKGDNVKLSGLHLWIKSRKPKPKFCEECKIKKPCDLANISETYKRDINDFRWLCRSCHKKEHDLKENRIVTRNCKTCNNSFTAKKSLKQKYCSKECADNGLKTGVFYICKTCNKEFWVTPSKLKYSKVQFCSNDCYAKSRRNRIIVKCKTCNKELSVVPAKIKRGEGKYCSRECYLKWIKTN